VQEVDEVLDDGIDEDDMEMQKEAVI